MDSSDARSAALVERRGGRGGGCRGRLLRAGMTLPVSVGVHAVFAGKAHDDLVAAGAVRIATCNTIRHVSNEIDVSRSLGTAIRDAAI